MALAPEDAPTDSARVDFVVGDRFVTVAMSAVLAGVAASGT
jgi:hypothetical protein